MFYIFVTITVNKTWHEIKKLISMKNNWKKSLCLILGTVIFSAVAYVAWNIITHEEPECMCEMDDTKYEREDFDATTQRKVIILDVSPDAVGDVELTEDIINNTIAVIHTRLERLGTEQVTVQKVEGQMGHYMVELPVVEEPERVRKLIVTPGNLEFWETYNVNELQQELSELNSALSAKAQLGGKESSCPLCEVLNIAMSFGCMMGVAEDTAAVNDLINSFEAKQILPSDLKFLWGAKPVAENEVCFPLYAIRTRGANGKAPLSGEYLTKVEPDSDTLGRPCISMKMNSEGAARWAMLTESNIGRAIAIVIDGTVFSAPNVLSKIDGGKSQISGNFTHKEVKDLANVLGSGKLPLPVRIVQEYVFAR